MTAAAVNAADSFGLGGTPDWVVIAVFVVLTGTTGMLSGVAAAAGEEIGEYTRWVAGDLGLGLVVVAAIVAAVFWAMRHRVTAPVDNVSGMSS